MERPDGVVHADIHADELATECGRVALHVGYNDNIAARTPWRWGTERSGRWGSGG